MNTFVTVNFSHDCTTLHCSFLDVPGNISGAEYQCNILQGSDKSLDIIEKSEVEYNSVVVYLDSTKYYELLSQPFTITASNGTYTIKISVESACNHNIPGNI